LVKISLLWYKFKKSSILILFIWFSTINISAHKKIFIKFKKIWIKPKELNITQTVGCQELLVKDYKIYAALYGETSKTQYVQSMIYINTIYRDSFVRLYLLWRKGITVIQLFTILSSFGGEIKQIFFTSMTVCPIKPVIISLDGVNGFFFQNG